MMNPPSCLLSLSPISPKEFGPIFLPKYTGSLRGKSLCDDGLSSSSGSVHPRNKKPAEFLALQLGREEKLMWEIGLRGQ